MTREYPPQVYGGAGVHVEYLSRELAKSIESRSAHCWGTAALLDDGNLHVIGDEPPDEVTAGTDADSRPRWMRQRWRISRK